MWASFLFVAAWAVFLPLAPAVSLGSGRIVVGVFAIACLAVTLVAVTKRQSATGKPWWKATKTARQAFIIGLLQAVYGLGVLVAYFFDGALRYELIMAANWLTAAGFYLASAVVRWRHERSGPVADSPLQRYLLVLDTPLLAAGEQLDPNPIDFLAGLPAHEPREAVVLSLAASPPAGLPAAELVPSARSGRFPAGSRPDHDISVSAEHRMKVAVQHLEMIGFTARGTISDEDLAAAVRREFAARHYDQVILATARPKPSWLARVLGLDPVVKLRRLWGDRLIVFPA